MRLIERQADSAAKNANLTQCTLQSGISASLFSMPDLVKPLDKGGGYDLDYERDLLTRGGGAGQV